jgi:hypothetical protein
MNKIILLAIGLSLAGCGSKVVVDKDLISEIRSKDYSNVVLGRKQDCKNGDKGRLFVGTHKVQGRSKGQICWSKTDSTNFTVSRLSAIVSQEVPPKSKERLIAIPNHWKN